jgi:hypothetical protein
MLRIDPGDWMFVAGAVDPGRPASSRPATASFACGKTWPMRSIDGEGPSALPDVHSLTKIYGLRKRTVAGAVPGCEADPPFPVRL